MLDGPDCIETARLHVRPYRAGDGPWYFAMSCKNREHLLRYESGNVVMSITSEEVAESTVRELAVDWRARKHMFLGAFAKDSGDFVAQIYIGAANPDLPEFRIGYFADVDHEGQGYVAEAVGGALAYIFDHLQAHRVSIECDDTNHRSIRVAERCGFVAEGHFRENKLNADGTVTGTRFFGLLRSEYQPGQWKG
jgi:RimJ/RimL family protein N-acetyltransferase